MKLEVEQTDMLGARAGKLTIGSVTIETPTRILTHTDLHNADAVMRASHEKIAIDFPHKLYQVKRAYPKEKLQKLATSKKVYQTEVSIIRGLLRKKPDAVGWFEASIGQKISVSDKENITLLNLGLDAGAKVNTIYDCTTLTVQQLAARIKDCVKITEKNDACQGIVVRMPILQSRKAIEAKTKLAVENTDGVDYKYSKIENVHEKYLTASNILSKKDKFFGLSDVPKTWGGNERTSLMHIAELYGFDAFSLRLGKWFETARIPPRKRFDRTSLGHLVIPQEHARLHGQSPACFSQCPVDKHYVELQQLLDDLSPTEQVSAFRVHEAYDSQADFGLKRQAIMEGKNALLNQLRKQSYAREPIKKIFGNDIAEPNLLEF